ncbi:MAG: hypothetical protein WDN49_09305 [Acetobacteraceae bacterium]
MAAPCGCAASPGAGTTVEVFFRRADERERPAQPRLLLVDDDADVRGIAAAPAAGGGVSRRGGRERPDRARPAVHRAVRRDAGDLGMPGMSGIELAAIVGQRHPALPIIFLTGNADPGASGPN